MRKIFEVPRLTLIVLLVFLVNDLFCGLITRNAKFTGSNLVLNNVIDLQEDLHDYTKSTSPGLWDFADKSVMNRVFLRYSGASKIHYSTAWSVQMGVKIERFDKFGSALPVQNTVLSINYDPASTYNDYGTYVTTGGYRVKVTITSITLSASLGNVIPQDVSLENEIEIERYYNLQAGQPLFLSNHSIVNNSAEIFWDYIKGAEEFDLEYILVSDYIVPSITSVSNVDFSNATRVSSLGNSHKINLAFDNGKVYYRVRPVGKGGANFTERLEGSWVYCTAPINVTTNFHTKSNWTYSATFAEDAKSKEIVSFFDGSQRNRQTISLSNTNDVTLVAETFYDFEGRLAIQSLPAPDKTYSNQLKYFADFNLNNKSTPTFYTKKDFDDGNCAGNNYAMSTLNGASNYYSASNTYFTSSNSLMYYSAIPDAFKYPMSRTTFNNENERRAVSGVGNNHKIGSTHETSFLNASASQEKLDRLFGNEVGYAQHYKEEVVIDPNGQISVSYKNLSGQVVATAMRSESPLNLLTLQDPSGPTDEPYMIPEVTKEDLTVLNQFNSSNNSFVVSKDFLVTGSPSTPYNFVYEITPQTFQDLCTNTDFPCKYLLTISIKDECGNVINANGAYSTYLNVPHPIDPVLYPTGYAVAFTVNFPTKGVYKIEKELKLDPAALASYITQYQALAASPTNTCVKSLSQLESEMEANMDTEECGSCEDYCVKQADDKWVTLGNPLPVDHNSPIWIALFENCKQGNCTESPSRKNCDGLLEKLKQDVSPGGQYFNHMFPANTSYNVISGIFTTGPNPVPFIDMLVALNQNQPGPGLNAFIINFSNYLTSNSSCPSIPPSGFNQSYINANWDDCYADFLVQFHPEYCRYLRCKQLESSETFDYLLQTLNYTTAQNTDANGNICVSNPGCALIDPSVAGPFGTSLLSKDPFFLGNCPNLVSNMNNELSNCPTCASIYPGPSYGCAISGTSMWDYAACIPTPLVPSSPNFLNDKWKNFMVLYEYVKKKLQSTSTCPNLVTCPGLNDGSVPPDLITSGYGIGNNSGINSSVNPPIVYPINNGLNINDPDFNVTLNSIMSSFPPSSSTTPPGPGFGSNYGPNDCWYDASYIDLGSDYDNASQCPMWQSSSTPYPPPTPPFPNNCTGVTYSVSSVPGYPGSIQISNKVYFPVTTTLLNRLIAIAADINTYISVPDFSASVNTSNPSNPKLIITAPVSLGAQTTNSFPPIQLSIQRYHIGCPPVDKDLCQYKAFSPAIKHCETINGPECVCTTMSQLATAYASLQSPSVTLMQYLTTELNNLFSGFQNNGTICFVTEPQVTYWYNNCVSNNGTPYPLDVDGEPDPITAANLGNTVPPCVTCEPPCNEQAEQEADFYAQQEFENQVAQSIQNFINNYTNACLKNLNEKFTVDYSEKEYHYTLYYYDQAGNLVRTVPPVAVKRIPASVLYTGTGGLNIINQLRTLGTYSIYPGHTRVGQISGSPSAANAPNSYVTNYVYNSYNNLIAQETPDGGLTEFWYDDLGRLRFSQNDKQKAAPCYACSTPFYFGRYSYTNYDNQSRIIEVGENEEVYFTTSGTPPAINILPFYYAANIQTFPSLYGEQVTKTYYDAPLSGNPVSSVFTGGQKELRKRVSTISYEDIEDTNDNTYEHSTHFSYDVHGNVKQLVQDNQPLTVINEQYKLINYEYDLISGKVNAVHYQSGKIDQYHHRYYYDAENKLTTAYSSRDNVHWEREARYFYYLHGPLARTELADEKVQGLDYLNTIQGWLKVVNANVIDEQKEFGLDGNINTSIQYMNNQQNIHSNFARDVFGYSIDYYDKDYMPIAGSIYNNVTGNISASIAYNTTSDLFNGNIRALTHAITNPVTNTPINGLSRWFKYDQLNRIKESNVYIQGTVSNDLGSSLASTTDYYEKFRYDANGNILYARRNGYTGGSFNNSMDDMYYNYYTGNNKLEYVKDGGDNSIPANFSDIKNQIPGNYQYDLLGNLISDAEEQINNIEWSLYGKIRTITRSKVSLKPDLEFLYDASGNRICKIVKPRAFTSPGFTSTQTQEYWDYTYYVRDAQGNVMAVYNRKINYVAPSSTYTDKMTLVENNIYGSSRVAVDNRNETTNWYQLNFLGYKVNGTLIGNSSASILPSTIYVQNTRTLGNKVFELTNHLGNVLNTVSDRKKSVDSNSDGFTDFYKADTKTGTDYYSFGAPMPNRQFNVPGYRYGFNGKENDNEVKGTGNQQDYGLRIFDPRLGKFLSIDPLTSKYPELTPYQFGSNRPIDGVDLDGAEWQPTDDKGKDVAADANNIASYRWVGYSKFAYQNPDGSISKYRQSNNAKQIGIEAPKGTVSTGYAYGSNWARKYTSNQFTQSGTIELATISQENADKISTLHPDFKKSATKLVLLAQLDLKINLRITDANRTFAEQDALYAKGRTSGGKKVTNAIGGQSLHNYGIAIDVAGLKKSGGLNYDINYQGLGKLGESLGLEWGGNWTTIVDKPHFQLPYTLKQLQSFTFGKDGNLILPK